MVARPPRDGYDSLLHPRGPTMPRLCLVVLLVFLASPARPQDPPAYVAPKGDGPVVELLEDVIDPLIPLLSNPDGAQQGTAVREDLDVFAGLSALRVTQV